ncbi:MFS transporter [Prauserella cavernicola]|uniref:MFS transporter n=1 Tax=Prauserella cavernicola TaxID=2800127 RepID=A0A934QVW2_9PSEU|nr:MFS transporter [Prauserella cavernicola]MBK1787353.1 MFS transporter [Prauserella cavernicola]
MPRQRAPEAPHSPLSVDVADPPAPTGRRRVVFAVVSLALLMGSIDQTAVATALPALQADLGAALSWAGWTVTVYMVGQIIALPLAGRLSDQFGRRRVFLTAVAAFTVASVLSGLAPSIETLVGSRLLQGLAAGAFLPSATGIVSDLFGADRDRAIASFTSIFPIGAIIGPTVGGILVTSVGWRGIFLVNVPVGLAVFVAAWFLIPRSSPRADERVDGIGIVLLVAMLLGGMVAISVTGSELAPSTELLVALCAGTIAVVSAAILLHHLRRAAHPLVPLQLLRGKTFTTLNIVNFMFGVAALGQASLVPWFAITRYGMDPLLAGGLLTFRALGMISASMLSVAVIRRIGYRPLLITGSAFIVAGLLVLALPAPDIVPAPVWIAVSTALTGIGMGLGAPASGNAGLHLAPQHVSAVSGLRGMFRQSGGIAGITVLTAVVSSSADPVGTQAIGYVVLAAILLLTIPLMLRLPNLTGRW